MKIYTKKGDEGLTSLYGGSRVPKHHIRIEAYGTVDELNSFLGLLRDQEASLPYRDFIKKIQDTLFTLGSHLASDPSKSGMKLPEIPDERVQDLETSMDEMDGALPALKNFVLPGGHPANSYAHIARCVCRRAERLVVHLNDLQEVEAIVLRYLNRLSDWLFMYARTLSKETGSEEILWKP